MPATLNDVRCPPWERLQRYVKDPEVLTSEVLFLILTLANVFVMYRLFLDVIPYPVFVTWWQLLQGLFMAWCLGESGREFQKLAYFPRVELIKPLLRQLLIPTVFYCAMLVLANVLLAKIPTIATFPVAVSFTIVLHHCTRFVGCGEEYMPMRWQSILLLTSAFVLGCTDSKTLGTTVLPWALLYACASATFRAGFLQRIMHTVEGRGNALHNHQHIIGVLILPIVWLACGEGNVFFHMPYNFASLHTWQMWGCLFTVGALPFFKNIVSNRLIRRSGQGPWRFLEIVSIGLVFVIGLGFGIPGWQGFVSTFFVILGRLLGAVDVLTNAEEADIHAQAAEGEIPRRQNNQGASRPFLNPIDEDDAEQHNANNLTNSDASGPSSSPRQDYSGDESA